MHTSMQEAELEIKGLAPGMPTRGVCSALECIRGVQHVEAMPDLRHVIVTFDAYRASPRQFETAVRVMGCDVESMTMRIEEHARLG